MRRISNFFSYFARRAQGRKSIILFWKLAGLNFEGRDIRRNCFFDTPNMVYIGKNTFVNYENYFHTSNSNAVIKIGNNCDIAPQCMFMCTSHDIGNKDHRAGQLKYNSIIIGDGCWIGTRSVILPGVHLGEGSIVAAGSVVTKSFPANVMLGGVPAKIIKELK